MTTLILAPPNEVIHLSGISWNTYETLLEELSDRRLRLTYNRGNLEIMAPSPEHELNKRVLGRFIETIAEELEVCIYPLGSTTFKSKPSGAEPDKCFYIRNIAAVQGKRRLDMSKDPAPDLIVEIDITSSSQDRLQVYADLRVAEVWVYNGESLVIQQLQHDTYYIPTQTSQFFVNLPISDIAEWLQRSPTMDYLQLIKSFRGWVRSQIGE